MTTAKPEDLTQARYLVSFISLLSSETKGYEKAAEQMMNEVVKQPGFIAVYSARDNTGVGITNSYWSSIESISHWKSNSKHQAVQKQGKSTWYQWYQLQICEIKRSYVGGINASSNENGEK
ncbi:MAG: antibiotic biosynthesis monooxygenase family protein [Kangiellaceae bacterium]